MQLHHGSKCSAGGPFTGLKVPVQVLVCMLQVCYDQPRRCTWSKGKSVRI